MRKKIGQWERDWFKLETKGGYDEVRINDNLIKVNKIKGYKLHNCLKMLINLLKVKIIS
jgi:hypothetical protein